MVNLKNLIRIGTVSSINYRQGKLRVCFEDQDSIVTDELPMLSFEYEMPKIGEPVLCLFLGNGISNGFCLGRYYYDSDLPVEYGQDIYFKRLLKDATIKYDRAAKTYTLIAKEIVFNGNLQINGNLSVSGNTSIGGNATIGGEAEIGADAVIGGISFLNHVHGGISTGLGRTQKPE
jgi:phage baseplate assembly protein V